MPQQSMLNELNLDQNVSTDAKQNGRRKSAFSDELNGFSEPVYPQYQQQQQQSMMSPPPQQQQQYAAQPIPQLANTFGIWSSARSPFSNHSQITIDESPFEMTVNGGIPDGWGSSSAGGGGGQQDDRLRRNSTLTDPPPQPIHSSNNQYASVFRSSSFSGGGQPRLDTFGSSPTYQSFRQAASTQGGATSPRMYHPPPASNTNILERFHQVAEQTREAEMVNGMKMMNFSNNQRTSELNSPTTPYMSPTPMYAGLDYQAAAAAAAAGGGMMPPPGPPPGPPPPPMQPHSMVMQQQPPHAMPSSSTSRSNSMTSVWRPSTDDRMYPPPFHPQDPAFSMEGEYPDMQRGFMQKRTPPPPPQQPQQPQHPQQPQQVSSPPIRSNSRGSMYHHPRFNRAQQQQQQQQGGQREGLRSPFEQGLESPPPAAAPARKELSGIRSPLLEEFRANKNKKYELSDFYGHIVEFSGDQHGSRFIQQRLESASSEEKETIFNEIYSNSLQLMTDVFGNYVIQKFFELGNQMQKTFLAKQMEGHILNLSLQMYGCRVVQKAIEHVLTDQQAVLVKELDGNVLKCVKDQNGNHVIQKAIERVPGEYITFIMSAFNNQVYQLATHPYGCRVIQRMLEHSGPDSQAKLLGELHNYTQYLVEDQYGNYVIQHVVQRGKPADKKQVIDIVRDNVLNFSRHKYASNVVEKCIMCGSVAQRGEIIDEILKPRPHDGSMPITVMMRDQFANYVIQKLLEVTRGAEHDRLVDAIKPQLQALKKYSYGKHLISIEKLLHATAGNSTVAY